MRVLDGGAAVAAADDEVAARADAASRLVVDVGTGDGRFALRLARQHPDWLVVGIDPARDRMLETARRAARKPQRGGAGNILLVWASIEDDLSPLHHRADEVLVLAPWGRLLAGVVRPDHDIVAGLRAVAAPGAQLTVTWGARVWDPPVPDVVRNLSAPPFGPVGDLPAAFVQAYRSAGWDLTATREVGPEDLADLGTSWSRRLADHPRERFGVLAAQAR